MKNVIAIIVFALFMGSLVYAFQIPFSFCDIPVTYKIGSIDSRFDLSQTDALTDIEEATKILNTAYGKNLFDYASTSGEVSVNFIYDQRTALDISINQEESQISKTDTALNAKINTYEADVKIFEQKLADFNNIIQKYNSQGGAPRDIYNNLISQQNQLKSEGDALNARARELNLETHNYNSSVKNLGQNVSEFNQALLQKPEEGFYDAEQKTISIYFINNKPELIHTLAHEFGHAIGMQHVTDPLAIMYPQTSKYLEFTNADKEELGKVCKSFPLPSYWIYQLRQEASKL